MALMFAFAPYFGGIRETFAKKYYGLQIARAATLTITTLCTIYTFMHLPLATGFSIIFLSPIVAKILSMLINRERIPWPLWLISVTGLAGVLIVLRPGITVLNIGHISALCVPLFFATSYVLSRTIGEDNQTRMSANIYCDAMLIVLFAVPMMLQFEPMPLPHFLLAVLYSTLGAVGTVCVALAYARAPTAYVSSVHYTQIIWGALWGALLFNEYPDFWTIVGAGVIIAAGLALVWQSRKV